jgi:hypothetical protein
MREANFSLEVVGVVATICLFVMAIVAIAY